jgi:hypothetical protein
MPISCLAGRHAPGPEVLNQGFAFCRCTRCGRQMIRSHNVLTGVPGGFRVVWRRAAAPAAEVDAAQLALDLAAPRRALVAPIPAPARRRRGALFAGLDLAVAALRLLGEQLGEGLRAWVKALLSARPRRRLLRLRAS